MMMIKHWSTFRIGLVPKGYLSQYLFYRQLERVEKFLAHKASFKLNHLQLYHSLFSYNPLPSLLLIFNFCRVCDQMLNALCRKVEHSYFSDLFVFLSVFVGRASEIQKRIESFCGSHYESVVGCVFVLEDTPLSEHYHFLCHTPHYFLTSEWFDLLGFSSAVEL